MGAIERARRVKAGGGNTTEETKPKRGGTIKEAVKKQSAKEKAEETGRTPEQQARLDELNRQAEADVEKAQAKAKAEGDKSGMPKLSASESAKLAVYSANQSQVRRGGPDLAMDGEEIASCGRALEICILELMPSMYEKSPGIMALGVLLMAFGGREYSIYQRRAAGMKPEEEAAS